MSELMGNYQSYLFAALWLFIAIYLIYQGFKTHKLLILVSFLFFFMGIWYLVDQFISTDLFSNPYIWIFRGICIAFLIIIALFIIFNRKEILKQAQIEENEKNNKE